MLQCLLLFAYHVHQLSSWSFSSLVNQCIILCSKLFPLLRLVYFIELYLPKLFYSVLFYLISLQWTHFYAKIKPKFIFLEAWPDSRHTITFILSNNIKHTTWTCCEITDQVQKAHRSNNAETKLRFQPQGPRDGSANIWQQVVAKEKLVFFEWLTRICWTFAVGRVKLDAKKHTVLPPKTPYGLLSTI